MQGIQREEDWWTPKILDLKCNERKGNSLEFKMKYEFLQNYFRIYNDLWRE